MKCFLIDWLINWFPHVSSYLPQLLVRLLQVRGLPKVFVGVQVNVGVVLSLRRVAVALLALLQPLGVGLLVVLLALPVRLVRVQVGVFQMVTVVEPEWRGRDCNVELHLQRSRSKRLQHTFFIQDIALHKNERS